MKKIIIFYLGILLVLQLAAQSKTITIHGIVNDSTVKSIEISHTVDTKLSKRENKKFEVLNGAFVATTQIPYPMKIDIMYGDRYYSNYFNSNTNIFIDSVGNLSIINSPLNDEYFNDFLPLFKKNNDLFDFINSFFKRNYQTYGQELPKSVKDSATILGEEYYTERASLLKQYIKLHPNSYVALWDLYYFVALRPAHKYFDFQELFASFSNQMQRQPFMQMIKETLRENNKIEDGQIFPQDFFKGHEQMQSAIRESNQYYLIDFWFSSCSACIANFPKLKEIYNQFHSKGFEIVSISVDKKEYEKNYFAAIKKYKLPWHHIWDKNGATSYKFNINIFPYYILLDNNDRIISSNIEVSQLEDFLKRNL